MSDAWDTELACMTTDRDLPKMSTCKYCGNEFKTRLKRPKSYAFYSRLADFCSSTCERFWHDEQRPLIDQAAEKPKRRRVKK